MIEVLERFTIGNLLIVLAVFAAAWLIWPVVCGIVGARKGRGLEGFLHGMIIGPLGLVTILLTKPRHVLPTTGHGTILFPPQAVPQSSPAGNQSPGPKWVANAAGSVVPMQELAVAPLQGAELMPPPVVRPVTNAHPSPPRAFPVDAIHPPA